MPDAATLVTGRAAAYGFWLIFVWEKPTAVTRAGTRGISLCLPQARGVRYTASPTTAAHT